VIKNQSFEGSSDDIYKPTADCRTTCLFSCDGNALRLISGANDTSDDDDDDDERAGGNIALSPNTMAARRQTCLIRGPGSYCGSTAALELLSLAAVWLGSATVLDECRLAATFDLSSAIYAPDGGSRLPVIKQTIIINIIIIIILTTTIHKTIFIVCYSSAVQSHMREFTLGQPQAIKREGVFLFCREFRCWCNATTLLCYMTPNCTDWWSAHNFLLS